MTAPNRDPMQCPCGDEPVAAGSRYGEACIAARRDPTKKRRSRIRDVTTPLQRRDAAR